MDWNTLISFEWEVMIPEFIIIIAGLILSLTDLFYSGKGKLRVLQTLSLGGVVAAFIALVFLTSHDYVEILYGTFRFDSFAIAFKYIFLLATIFILLLSFNEKDEDVAEFRGEFYYLLMTAVLGAMFMASSNDLITLFVGLELLSISSYILVGLRKHNVKSNESALKYVVNGGVATALTLFGMSYLYGLTGTTNLADMNVALQQTLNESTYLLFTVGFLLMFVGLSFKVATAPFHMWAPDVYEGAMTSVTAFLSVVSKAAGFTILLRIFYSVFINQLDRTGAEPFLFTVQGVILIAAVATMIIGNIVALKQYNVKRMLAYSSIAHAGYLLVPIAMTSLFLFDTIWFYLVAYLFMNIGALLVIQIVGREGRGEGFDMFAGLYYRQPLVAVAMTIFILSLAGIPGTAGFIAKMGILLSAFTSNILSWAVIAGIVIATILSYVYYFTILQQMFLRAPSQATPIAVPTTQKIVLVSCIVGVVTLGIVPQLGWNVFFDHFDVIKSFVQ